MSEAARKALLSKTRGTVRYFVVPDVTVVTPEEAASADSFYCLARCGKTQMRAAIQPKAWDSGSDAVLHDLAVPEVEAAARRLAALALHLYPGLYIDDVAGALLLAAAMLVAVARSTSGGG